MEHMENLLQDFKIHFLTRWFKWSLCEYIFQMVYRHGYSKRIGSLMCLRSWKLSDQHTLVSPHITQLNPPRPCFSSVCLQLLLLLSPSSSLLITLHSIVSLSHCFVIIPLRHVYLFIYFALNLAVHRALKPPKSICPTPLDPSVTTVTPSVPFDLFALPSLASAGPVQPCWSTCPAALAPCSPWPWPL